MNVTEIVPEISVGVTVLGIGIGMMSSHARSWQHQQNVPNLSDDERRYYFRRYRRRMQISGMLALDGILIALGGILFLIPPRPLVLSLYWLGVLLLTGWVILLAMGDYWSTAARGKIELARVQQKKRELAREIVEFKHRHSDS